MGVQSSSHVAGLFSFNSSKKCLSTVQHITAPEDDPLQGLMPSDSFTPAPQYLVFITELYKDGCCICQVLHEGREGPQVTRRKAPPRSSWWATLSYIFMMPQTSIYNLFRLLFHNYIIYVPMLDISLNCYSAFTSIHENQNYVWSPFLPSAVRPQNVCEYEAKFSFQVRQQRTSRWPLVSWCAPRVPSSRWRQWIRYYSGSFVYGAKVSHIYLEIMEERWVIRREIIIVVYTCHKWLISKSETASWGGSGSLEEAEVMDRGSWKHIVSHPTSEEMMVKCDVNRKMMVKKWWC